jgi:hypothetical protein
MEEVLFEFQPCHVFRLPPTGYLSSALWEGGHIWSGKVRVVRRYAQDGISLPTHSVDLLENINDQGTTTVFAVCPLKDDAPSSSCSFQVANDSSRCFVLRVEQGDQHAYLGINFEEKADAFRFCTAIVERNKRLHLLAHSSNVAQQDAITRYAGSHANELRAEGKIEIDLLGKLATSTPNVISTATTAGRSEFSLDNVPRGAGGNRRVRQGGDASQPQAAAAQPHSESGRPGLSEEKPSVATTAAKSTQPPAPRREELPDPFADLLSLTATPLSSTAPVDPFAGLESQNRTETKPGNTPLDAFF